MHRRAFVAGLPATLIGSSALAQTGKGPTSPEVPSSGETPPSSAATKRWEPGAPRFVRPDVYAGDRPVGASFASRTAAYGIHGAAGTAHPLATQAGIETLKRGGSAADAAIVINACLGLLEPTSSGIGGDCYAMLWDPKAGKVVGLAGSGASPRALTLEIARARARNNALPPLGAASVSVPGAVDAWWTLHQRYGRLKWRELFAPAIAIAEEGAPVPDVIARSIRGNLAAFLRPDAGVEETANAIRTYGLSDGKGPLPGQVFRNPDLARTYRAIAAGGRDAFYQGEIAATIERYSDGSAAG